MVSWLKLEILRWNQEKLSYFEWLDFVINDMKHIMEWQNGR